MGIALKNVSFTYQEGTPLASTALSDVSLTIEDGSYTALILSLIHISEPTILHKVSRMPSSA